MMDMMTSPSPLEISLPVSVETMLEKIYKKHYTHHPVSKETRKRLSSVSEEIALQTLYKVHNVSHVKSTLNALINFHLGKSGTVNSSPLLSSSVSPVECPRTPGKKSYRLFHEMSLDFEAPSPKSLRIEENGGSSQIPEVALGELMFNKVFLLLSYIGGRGLGEVITADEIRQWKNLSMVAYETAVWDRLGWRYCPRTDQRVPLKWDSANTHYYQCHVASDGSYRFKGPLMEKTGTHLHKVLGDDNVLTVKFAHISKDDICCNDPYPAYKRIAKNGIMIGLRRYQFFAFKDGGKEEKKKDYSTNGVKCYFIRTDSTASSDRQIPYILSGMSIHEARMYLMHVHTLPSLARYMARFSLILSKTKTLEVDMTGITVEQIDDIHCLDQYGNVVLDKNGKPRIHSDGTGYISEDLARLCPLNVYKGKCTRSGSIQGTWRKDAPLLIQFRMFYYGGAFKGTCLLNKKLPPQTIQVRPSMIKVHEDLALSDFSTSNSIEVVTTSNPPRNAKLSRNLIALLSYGGVPNDFFLDILRDTLEESKTAYCNEVAALKATKNYWKMDDNMATEMVMALIPLDEPYLKHHFSILLKTEKNNLKAGKLPVSDSYYLMGTVDPTGELKENEVCVIQRDGQISGDVLVYRNPGLHFGDIHVLKATYVKSLEEYVGNSKYAVFFPQKGPRSLGDEIAGGDFDGDMYFISRNPTLLETFKPSEPWVSSSPPSKTYTGPKPCDFSPEDLEAELFKSFLKTRFDASNVIGKAADNWLAITDGLLTLGDDKVDEKHERKKRILNLIDIYYDALDAPKNGAKVSLPNVSYSFPHYMKREKSFHSTSVLGLIYDLVESHNAEEPPQSEIKKLPCFEAWTFPKPHMDKCELWYNKYKDEMSRALNHNDQNMKKKLANEVNKRYKQEFYGAASLEESKRSLDELYSESLALYNISYNYAIKQNNIGNCGFVWKVAGQVLCKFYREQMQEDTIPSASTALKRFIG